MKRPEGRFFRLTIARKLVLGFLACGILPSLIALISLFSLRQLNEINNWIIERDVPLVEITDEMGDALLGQELYGRRAFLLKSQEIAALFWSRSERFQNLLQDMRRLPYASSLPLLRLNALHEDYNHLFQTAWERREDLPFQAFQDYDGQIKRKQEEVLQLVKDIATEAKRDQDKKRLQTVRIGRLAFWITTGLSIGSLLLGIGIALVITRTISRSIRLLKLSTQEISEGKFDLQTQARSQDELGDLFQDFRRMAQRLKLLEEMHWDANPLTRLPGGAAIENRLRQRLQAGTPLSFCYLDLSHFKAFNDRYGYARGNVVIQETAKMVMEAVQAQGNGEDFVGHIGGDDFVVITSPERHAHICGAIIDSFDKRAPDFYDPEDRQRGYILGETRQGQQASFPIMTLAIAAVTNRYRRLYNHVQVGEIATELKNYAKSFSKSVLIEERRKETDSRNPQGKSFSEPEQSGEETKDIPL